MCQGCRNMGLVGADGDIDLEAVLALFRGEDDEDADQTRMDASVNLLRTVAFGDGSLDKLNTPAKVMDFCERSGEAISRQMSGYTIAVGLMMVLHRYETLLGQWATLQVDTVDDGEFPDDMEPVEYVGQDGPELDIFRTEPAPSLGDFRPGMYL